MNSYSFLRRQIEFKIKLLSGNDAIRITSEDLEKILKKMFSSRIKKLNFPFIRKFALGMEAAAW
jgi:hypothetical protein